MASRHTGRSGGYRFAFEDIKSYEAVIVGMYPRFTNEVRRNAEIVRSIWRLHTPAGAALGYIKMDVINRRHLLLGSLAALQGARLRAADEPVNTAFIGVGNRGSYLLKGALDLPGVKVVALCDIKPDRLDRAATLSARDNPQTYTEWRRIIDREDVNAVFIATPCDLHVEMAIAALRAGKHIYCEKPVGITPESINELWRAGKNARTVWQTGLGMRSSERNKTVIGKIHEGVAGKVIMVKAQRTAGNDLDHNGSSSDWFFNAKRSGDVIVEMAVHNLDVCNWVINSRPERAGGFGGTLLWVDDPPGRTNMDGYTVSYEYQNGVKLSFTQVFFHPGQMPGGSSSSLVYGTEGGVDLGTGTYYPRERGAAPVKLVEGDRRERGPGQRDTHIAGFFESIRTGAPTTADLRVGCTASLTSILGREAIYRKKVVSWTDLGIDRDL